ncbi:MAG: CoA transferase [Burkholderiaceae bacterium]|nr:CoA transferase [Burkholderiaceae bacterium]
MNTADLSALKPLAGIRVLEICNVAAGPFCALLLADLGADVIKLENLGTGDTLRAWPPHTGPENDRLSENFASLNRNKRSVTLDLKNPDDNAKAKNLIANADVLIENNRPGVMKRLGLDFDSALAINPKLIYCSISAYGQTGPRANEGGFDVTIQAMSGIMSVTGEPDGAPVKCGVPVADFTAGLYGAMSICAQLRAVAQTGKGVHIDVPMMGTSLAIAALQTSEYFGVGKDPVKLQALWETVCQILKSPELLKDERFGSTSLRAKNQIVLKELIEAILQKDTAVHWIEQFSQAGVPCCPINQYSAVLNDPQTLAMGWVQPMVMANGQQTKTVINPIKFNGTTAPIERRPPRLGEHNSEIVE